MRRGDSLNISLGLIIPDMSLDGFFNLLYQLTIILAIITFGMFFLHLFTSKEEPET